MNILLLGGSGFVGSALAARLVRDGHDIAIPTRNPERAKHLTVLPTAEIVEADAHDPETLDRLVQDRDAVINLVGILKGGEGAPYGPGFGRAHVDLPRKVARAARKAGVRRLLHMSALGASADAPSGYLRSKADGEAAAFSAGPEVAVTVFRPSVIFGRGDSFLNLFARLSKMAPFLPLACPDARFQPVWVGDVAAAYAAALDHPESAGRAHDLCGPKVYRLRELVAYAGKASGHPRLVFGLPNALSYLQAWAMEFLPNGPMTRDNLRSMRVPSVCKDGCAFPFGIEPTPLEAVVPGYLAA